MPKTPISQLGCVEKIEDGTIEIRYFGQFNTKIHHHEQTQLISPEKGTVYLYSECGNYCIPSNHYVYVAPNVKHRLISRSQNLKLKTIYLNLSHELDGNDGLLNIQVFSPSLLLDNLLDFGIRHLNSRENTDLKAPCLASLKMMLPFLLTNPIQLYTQAPKSEKLLYAIEFIIDSLGENLTITSISEKANMSERSLFRLFKKETGMTLFQFIKLSRMQRAIELMEDPTLSISEIVYQIGYESIATFSNIFKQLVGMSPQKYRNHFFKC